MERVALRLEQSLPQLEQLLAAGVFTRDELRALTTQRSAHEASLARLEVAFGDFDAYIHFEDRAEQLRVLRCRSPRVAEALTPHDERKLKSAYISRGISIFERAVRRLKADLRVWLAYADWARRHSLHVVLGRVLGRAIVLHPKQPSLWILAARRELALDPWGKGARALLLRALRVNRPAPPVGEAAEPPRKKSKSAAGPRTADTTPRKGLLYVPQAYVRDYAHLALEYVRMEVTLIERTRRRFTKLGIDLGSPLPPPSASEQQPDQVRTEDDAAEREAVKLSNMPAAEPAEVPPAETSEGSQDVPADVPNGPSDERLLAVVRHAIEKLVLPVFPDQASQFAFLVGVYRLLLSFPFTDTVAAPQSGQHLRNTLLTFLLFHMPASVESDFLRSGADLVKPTPLWALDPKVSRQQETEEMDSFSRLRAAGELRLILADSELEDLFPSSPAPGDTLMRLGLILAGAVKVRRQHDDTSLPPSLVAWSKAASSVLGTYLDEDRKNDASLLAEGNVHLLQGIRGGEPTQLGKLLDALLAQAYQSAKRGKYLSPPLIQAYFSSLPLPLSEGAWAERAEALRKSLRAARELSLPEQEQWAPIWEMYLDALVRGHPEIENNSPEAMGVREQLFSEHVAAAHSTPTQVDVWTRAVTLIRGSFVVRDKKVDKWALSALEKLVTLSRRSVSSNTDSTQQEGKQVVHDRLLAAVAATPAQLSKTRSGKSTCKMRVAVRGIIRSDPVASAAFWLAHARTEAALFRSLDGEERDLVGTYLATLWSRLRNSTATDATLLIPARLLWLRHLLRDMHDGTAALAALDVSRRDAAALDARLVPLIEEGWQRLSDGRPDDADDDEEDEEQEEDEAEDDEEGAE